MILILSYEAASGSAFLPSSTFYPPVSIGAHQVNDPPELWEGCDMEPVSAFPLQQLILGNGLLPLYKRLGTAR